MKNLTNLKNRNSYTGSLRGVSRSYVFVIIGFDRFFRFIGFIRFYTFISFYPPRFGTHNTMRKSEKPKFLYLGLHNNRRAKDGGATMDTRLIALKHLKGKPGLLDEFSEYYADLMQDLGAAEDWETLKQARVMLHEQLDYVTGLALESDDRPQGMG